MHERKRPVLPKIPSDLLKALATYTPDSVIFEVSRIGRGKDPWTLGAAFLELEFSLFDYRYVSNDSGTFGRSATGAVLDPSVARVSEGYADCLAKRAAGFLGHYEENWGRQEVGSAERQSKSRTVFFDLGLPRLANSR